MDLPPEFFAPAPLRRPGVLAAAVEKRYGRRRALTLILRAVALLGGTGLFVMLLVTRGRWQVILDPAAWSLHRVDTWAGLLLTAAALLVIFAGIRHQWAWYVTSFRIAGGVYLAAVACHVIGLLSGGSALQSLHLADYAAYPAIFLMLSVPVRLGLPLAITTLAVVSGTHQGIPPSISNLVEALWALLLVLPFLLLINSVMRSAEKIDQEAGRRYAENLQMVRSKALLDTETRFLGYVHDRVLQHLDGIRRGLIAPERLEVDPPAGTMDMAQPLPSNMGRGVLELSQALRRLDPEMPLGLPAEIPTRAFLPAEALSLITDAAVAALDNSLRHAPQARRWAEIQVRTDKQGNGASLHVTISDDGPGFRVADIDPERAGVRVAILGRMDSAPGLTAAIDTEPGQGTRVTLWWRRHQESAVPAPGVPADEVREMFDLRKTFNAAFALAAGALILLKGLGHDHSERPGWFVASLVLAGIVLAGLAQGRSNRLPWRPALVVAFGLVAFAVLASLENVGLSAWWPPLWYASVFAYLCLLLAIRGRPGVAWLVMFAGGAAMLWLTRDSEVADYLTVSKMMGLATLLVPGTLVPLALYRLMKVMASGLVEDIGEDTDLAVAASRRSYISESVTWLQRQLDEVLDPGLPVGERICGAHLLELQLRDSIRSPRFSEPDTNRAVWQARQRGITVRLRDDRSDVHGVDPAPQPVAHAELHRQLQDLLVTAEGEVTARIFPAGRATYATIHAARDTDGDELQSRQLLIPAERSRDTPTPETEPHAAPHHRESGVPSAGETGIKGG